MSEIATELAALHRRLFVDGTKVDIAELDAVSAKMADILHARGITHLTQLQDEDDWAVAFLLGDSIQMARASIEGREMLAARDEAPPP